MTEYCFVLDKNDRKLSPTKINKGWYLIRKQKAGLVSKYPMVIRLKKEVTDDKQDDSQFVCGIDDGSIHVGIAIVQQCKTKNKPVFKGVIEQRQDVKHLMDVRRGYRRYKRNEKRYRPVRFDNRSNSKRNNRIAPSIKQKKDAILRVINQLNKWINISEYHLEDVAIDIRALAEGHKLYKWQYQKTNRLDENLRKAALIRDSFTCQECSRQNCMLEAHHITPKRYPYCGADTLNNLITLCSSCHDKTENREITFAKKYYSIIKGKNIRFDYAQHVMQGKNYLRKELMKRGNLTLTNGGDTANKRIDWNIEKSHSNDAIVITDLFIQPEQYNIKDWSIKPMRKKYGKDKKNDKLQGYKHRDLIKYTKINGERYIGCITALYPAKKQCNITTLDGQILKRYGINRCQLMWRFNKIYWW